MKNSQVKETTPSLTVGPGHTQEERRVVRCDHTLAPSQPTAPSRLMPMCDGYTEAKLRRWGFIS